jgi:hypothetical protein
MGPVTGFDFGTETERPPGHPKGFPDCPQLPNPQSDADQLEAAADQAIAACGGDAREDNHGDSALNSTRFKGWRSLAASSLVKSIECTVTVTRN